MSQSLGAFADDKTRAIVVIKELPAQHHEHLVPGLALPDHDLAGRDGLQNAQQHDLAHLPRREIPEQRDLAKARDVHPEQH